MEIIARRATHRKEPLDRHQRHCIHTRPARPFRRTDTNYYGASFIAALTPVNFHVFLKKR